MATIEKVKPIVLTIEDKTYTLEFNRNSVASAERAGLVLADITTQPMNTLPLLFYAAFKFHHPEITRAETDRILFEVLGGLTSEEVARLGELFSAPTQALINEGGERKNAKISL